MIYDTKNSAVGLRIVIVTQDILTEASAVKYP